MSGKCFKCTSEFAGGDAIKCVDCSESFHVSCTRLGLQKTVTKAKLKSWRCDTCQGESTSVKSNEDSTSVDTQSILEAISVMKSEIISNTDKKVSEVDRSVSLLAKKFDVFEKKLDKIEEDQTKLDQRCDTLEQERDGMQREITELRRRLRDAEQHSRCSNLEITGVPLTPNESVLDILTKLACVIDIPFREEDVSIAHRLRLHSKKHVYPPIIVQFVSRGVKESWLSAARRKKRINSSDLSPSFKLSNIYVNEQLTPHNKELLGRARRMMKEKKIHYAGYINGKVLIKPSAAPDAVTLRIQEIEDLDKFDV